MLKKLANNQTVMVLAAAVAVAAIYYYSQGFSGSLSGMSGENAAAKAVDNAPRNPNAGPSDRQIQCAAGGSNFVPSQPLGQNGGNASANGSNTDTYGLPPSCAKQQVVDPSELLPKDGNSEFSKLNPMGAGDLKNVSLFIKKFPFFYLF